MNNFEFEIWDKESRYVTYYTVKWVDGEKSEMQKFYDKFRNHPEYQQKLRNILDMMYSIIGDKYGAIDAYFTRVEAKAQALPPKPNKNLEVGFVNLNFPLRLYCLRLTPSLVVLFNGGIKSADTAQESEDLSMEFQEANIFAKRIINEWLRTIYPDASGRRIIDKYGDDDIIL